MNDNIKPKLVINIGAMEIEGVSGDLHLTPKRLLNALKALRDDLNGQGIETTISVSNIDLDQFDSQAASK